MSVHTSKVIAVLLFIPALVLGGFRLNDGLQYRWKCEQHLTRAANANTVELAEKELETALKWIKKNHMTSGHTAIFFETPSNDVGFWYQNVQSSLEELRSLSSEAAPLEKSNMLLKLRETLLDKDDNVTAPKGISAYPDNKAYAFGFVLFGLFAAVGVLLLRKPRRGRITAIEVLTAVAIVGIILAVVIPNI